MLKARELAEQGAREALATLGVDQAKAFEHLKPEQKQLRNQLRARGRQAGDVLDAAGRQTLDHLVGVVAYEHWHRMLFARFLAENGLLLESEHQVPVSLADVVDLARDANLDVWDLAGRFAQKMLPAVFRADDPVLALPLARETRTQLEKLVGDLPREVFLADDSLGWTYQFWQVQRKEAVNASGKKIGADELSPVTQLFTEDYMVEFLLHNTLGAWWAGKLGPLAAASEEEARAKAGLPGRDGVGIDWSYLRLVQDEKTGLWGPAAGTFSGWPRDAKAVTFLDPCMGSGHFPVFALPLLARLRMEEEQFSCADAVAAVIRDNVYGLELDERCTQIAAFNLALAAWKLAGYQALPSLHFACSGLSPRSTEREWVALAGSDEKLQRGMERLYQMFRKAAGLGSLINPRADEGDLLTAAFQELQPLLEKALSHENDDDTAHEMVVTARGLAKAAEILASRFTLVATNVPYLGRGKQDEVLQEYCERAHPEAKADLATCFLERCLSFNAGGGSTAVVTPQNWLFLGTYADFRSTLLRGAEWDFIVRLGEGGFESAQAAGAFVALEIVTHNPALQTQQFAALDASASRTPEAKASLLRSARTRMCSQAAQLQNPDAIISLEENEGLTRLNNHAGCFQGISTGDNAKILTKFWELPKIGDLWAPFQTPPEETCPYAGRESTMRREILFSDYEGGAIRGEEAWHRRGVAIARIRSLAASLYCGDYFSNTLPVIVPRVEEDLPAIWAFAASPDFAKAIRTINQALSVDNGYIAKVPFDLAHWRAVAAKKFPNGLPRPFSSNPTQWLFNGHPKDSDAPLHVAVGRLLGYGWPRQTGSNFPDCPALDPDPLEKHADVDGIACLGAVRGERPAVDRLRGLLSAALGTYDERALIKATGGKATDLESWLRDEFFDQHCTLFQQRPFIWHIWDGLADGFHAFVNYHKLAAPAGAGRKLLETLTYASLGDWTRKQQDGIKRKETGAEDRLVAAQALQKQLEAVLRGEPPYDIFVRWKPLKQQPVGWEPDINDGVRPNIRPFMLANDVGRKGAGILRAKPGIKWEKDRGAEPMRAKADFPWFWKWDGETEDFHGGSEFDGNRWNNCHYTTAAKRAARDQTK